jgi:molecular chaperone GrpE
MTQEDLEKSEKELAEFKQKAEDYLASWKRTAADFENYKKRREKEDGELLQFAQEITVIRMLPTLESLEQALKQAPQDERFKSWSEGVVKIVQQLEKVLLEMGVEKIKTVGEKFDPTVHEAVETIESDKGAGTILEEIQTGYKLNDKVIRPAKVRVAK